MRYRELTEDFAEKQTLINIAGTIRQNCQPYLTQNPSAIIRHPLYRGVKQRGNHSAGPSHIISKEVRLTNRKPSDMPVDLHKFINGYFKKEYGAPFRNAMFANGGYSAAKDYGPVYIIFPIGNFKYLWSQLYEDLYTIASEYEFDEYGYFEKEEGVDMNKEVKQTIIDEVLSTYQVDNLIDGIDSEHEIMIRCKGYYGILANAIDDAHDEINRILYK